MIDDYHDWPAYKFYNKYHMNMINKLIHILCIPAISWSVCVFLPFYCSFALMLFYAIFYSYIFMYEIKNTTINEVTAINLYLMIIWLSAVIFKAKCVNHMLYTGIVFTLSWIFQFIGHYFFERNRPALFDSLYQSFAMAPLFTFFEVLSFFE
tara:strand:+ start:159 stop:614 length:456 start_codon:yes stop_codon:yes gene_type:complete